MKVLGIGNTAEVLEYGADTICKLFKAGYPEEYVWLELQNAQILNRLGLPVPKAFGLFGHDGRTGILYERIYGTTLLEKIAQGEDLEEAFRLFIRIQEEFLAVRTPEFVPYKEWLLRSLKGKPVEGGLPDMIRALPDGDFVCHGDFHPGNIMIKPDGTPVVIDFMNVCRGCREYDIARTYYLLKAFNWKCQTARPAPDLYLELLNLPYKEIEPWVRMVSEYRKYE